MAGFGKSFDDAFKPAFTTAQAGTLDLIKEKIKLDAQKAEKATKLANIKTAAVAMGEKIIASGGDPKIAKLYTDGISEINDPDVAEKLYTAGAASFEQQMQDKIKQNTNLKLEGYKGAMAGITEITKSMAERGGYTPDQLVEIQNQAASKVSSMFGIGNQDMAQKISQSTQPTPQTDSVTNDFFNTPLPPKKTDKQLDTERSMQRGAELIDLAENNYNTISKKYGTGRLKGIATNLKGGLGDFLAKKDQAPEVAPYNGNLDGLAQFVGRNVYNDDRVSNEDRKAYRRSLAELTNTPAEAKIMFSTLRQFTKTGDVKTAEAIKLMIPKNGSKPLSPSDAIKRVNSGKAAEDEASAFLSKIGAKK